MLSQTLSQKKHIFFCQSTDTNLYSFTIEYRGVKGERYVRAPNPT